MMVKKIFICLLCITCIAIACDDSSSDEDNTTAIDSSKSPSVRPKCSTNLTGETTNRLCKIQKRRRRVAPAQASTSRVSRIPADLQPSCSGSSVGTRIVWPIDRTLAPETLSALDDIVQSVLSGMGYPGQCQTPVQPGTLSSIREESVSNQINNTDALDSDEEPRNHYRFLLDQLRLNTDIMLSSENLSDGFNLIEAELEIEPTGNPAVVYTGILAGSHRQAQIIAREIRELATQMLEEHRFSLQKLNELMSKIKKLKDLDGALRYSFNSLSAYVNSNIECVGSLYYLRIAKPLFKKYVDTCRELGRILEYLKTFSNKHILKFYSGC